MQTFLPYPSFEKSAACLDNKRLGKQRVETLQILNVLTGRSRGWRHHPAVKMWRGHSGALTVYGIVVCLEWTRRGFRDTCADKIEAMFGLPDCYTPPGWLGREEFHAAHRSNLLRKLPEHYSQFGWEEPPDLPYVWPSSTTLTKES